MENSYRYLFAIEFFDIFPDPMGGDNLEKLLEKAHPGIKFYHFDFIGHYLGIISSQPLSSEESRQISQYGGENRSDRDAYPVVNLLFDREIEQGSAK